MFQGSFVLQVGEPPIIEGKWPIKARVLKVGVTSVRSLMGRFRASHVMARTNGPYIITFTFHVTIAAPDKQCTRLRATISRHLLYAIFPVGENSGLHTGDLVLILMLLVQSKSAKGFCTVFRERAYI